MSLALSAVGFIEGVKYTLVPILAVILIAFGILFFFNNDKDSHSNELEGQEFDFDKGERDELYKEKWEKAIDNSNWDFSKNEFKEILDLEDEKEYVESEKTNSEEKAKVQEDSRKKLIPDNILDDLNVALGDLSEKAKELGKNINDSNLKNKNLTKSRKKQGFVFLNNDYLTKSILFGEDKLVVDSDEFTGANLQATFGELKVDLSRVTPKERDIYITNNVLFGETTIRIPESWVVYVNGSTFLEKLKFQVFHLLAHLIGSMLIIQFYLENFI